MVRIIFLNPPKNMPANMADFDGAYSLDIKPDELVALTKVIDDYIEIGSIKQDTFKEIEIPVSKKNRLLFQNVGNPNAINKTNAEIFQIQLLKGDFTYPSQGIQIVDYDDTAKTWSCTIFGDLNEWYRPLSNLYLNELQLGSVVYGQSLLDQQINLPVYQDGNLPIYSTVTNFGKWFINYNKTDNSVVPSQLALNDFRYFFSPYALIKQALCQVGYTLESPVMDTDWFRSLWCYLLDPDFEYLDDELTILDRAIDLVRTAGTLQFIVLFENSSTGKDLNGVVFWATGDSITDIGGHAIIRPSCGTCPIEDFYGTFYAGGMLGSFRFQGTVRLAATNPELWTPNSPSFITITCTIRKCTLYGINGRDDLINKSEVLASSQIIDKGSIINGTVKNYAFDIETGNIKTYQHDVIFVHFEYTATLRDSGGLVITEADLIPMTDLLNGYSFTNTVQRGVIEEGDNVELNSFLHKNYTCADLLKGIAHLLNLKVETDSYNKTVRLYPEFKIDLFKDGIQTPFFFDNSTDVLELTDKVQAGSMKQSFRNNELGRNVELKFKAGNDGYISGLDLDEEIHSKYIDLGSDYKDAKNELTNPLFSPTANTTDGRLTKQSNTTLNGATNYVPYIWEYSTQGGNEYPEKGFDINPRILFAYSPDNPSFNKFESTYVFANVSGLQQDFPFGIVYQDTFRRDLVQPFSQIMPDGVRSYTSLASDPATLQELTETVVYGNGVEPIRDDLYTIIYRQAITQAYFRIALEFLVMLDLYEFQNLSFRRKVHLKYKSGAFGEIDIFARISRVTDYVIGGNITTPMQLLPDGNTFACDIDFVEDVPELPMLNLSMHLDAAKGVNSGNPSNGESVSLWTDQIGGNNNMTQPTALDQPTYLSSGINNLPAIQFNDSYLETPDLPMMAGDDYSIWIVAEKTGTATGSPVLGNVFMFFANSYNSVPTNYMRLSEGFFTSTQYSIDSTGTLLDDDLAPNTIGVPYLFGIVKNGNDFTYYVNENIVHTATVAATGAADYGSLGSWNNSNFTGQISELAIYSEGNDSNKADDIIDYFKAKYGL